MSLDKAFKEATEAVKKVKTTPTEDEMLDMYAFYKQAVHGDCNRRKHLSAVHLFYMIERMKAIEKPGTFDLKGKYKWDAWNRVKGMDKDTAKRKYIEYTERIIKKYGVH